MGKPQTQASIPFPTVFLLKSSQPPSDTPVINPISNLSEPFTAIATTETTKCLFSILVLPSEVYNSSFDYLSIAAPLFTSFRVPLPLPLLRPEFLIRSKGLHHRRSPEKKKEPLQQHETMENTPFIKIYFAFVRHAV